VALLHRIDLDRTGDGDDDDPVDIDERTLALYVLDEAAGRWIKLSTDLGWVLGTGSTRRS